MEVPGEMAHLAVAGEDPGSPIDGDMPLQDVLPPVEVVIFIPQLIHRPWSVWNDGVRDGDDSVVVSFLKLPDLDTRFNLL